MISVPKVDFTH